MPKSEQKFIVQPKNQVGPFPSTNPDGTPFVFTESQFRELHPAHHLASDDDKEKYHKANIQRLLDLKAIAIAPPDAEPGEVPLSPEFDGEKNPAAVSPKPAETPAAAAPSAPKK